MPSTEKSMIAFSPYILWDVDGESFGMMHNETGEIGVFKKESLRSFLDAFFGLNF